MVKSIRSDRILELGKKLADELGLEPSVDTLGRWMAHYIAELINEVDVAESEDKPEIERRCASAILDLWQHRYVLPNGKRPYEDFEPIMNALERLDPTDKSIRYYAQWQGEASKKEKDANASQWLEIAEGIDYSARIIIRHCLVAAAQKGLKKSKDWYELANSIDGEEDVVELVVRITVTSPRYSAPVKTRGIRHNTIS